MVVVRVLGYAGPDVAQLALQPGSCAAAASATARVCCTF